jgi:hypothetical protein
VPFWFIVGTCAVLPRASWKGALAVRCGANGLAHAPLKYTALASTSWVVALSTPGWKRSLILPFVRSSTHALICARASSAAFLKSTSPSPAP